MRILVTRPWQDGEDTARRLNALGHQAVLAPLLETEFFDGPALALTGVQAILATSANGVRAFVRRSSVRDLPLFAVGPQTTDEARQAGFSDVRNADGDITDLARTVVDRADPAKGPLLHIRGENSKSELATGLMVQGFVLRAEILYAVRPLSLPPPVLADLRGGSIDAVLLFSVASAGIFRDALNQAGIAVRNLLVLCISAATAGTLTPLECAEVRVAAKPNLDSLLERLKE